MFLNNLLIKMFYRSQGIIINVGKRFQELMMQGKSMSECANMMQVQLINAAKVRTVLFKTIFYISQSLYVKSYKNGISKKFLYDFIIQN